MACGLWKTPLYAHEGVRMKSNSHLRKHDENHLASRTFKKGFRNPSEPPDHALKNHCSRLIELIDNN